MIKVFVGQDPVQIHLLHGLLESHGIPSEIRGEGLVGLRGEIPFTETFPELWVKDHQAERALEILRNR